MAGVQATLSGFWCGLIKNQNYEVGRHWRHRFETTAMCIRREAPGWW